jgi:hypothetical protein
MNNRLFSLNCLLEDHFLVFSSFSLVTDLDCQEVLVMFQVTLNVLDVSLLVQHRGLAFYYSCWL